MIDLLKKFFNIIIHRKQEIKQTCHFRNLMRGPKIYLNGKPYVKVKLRFVDTLSFDITKHLDQLETEIESQKNVLEKLLSLKTNYEKKIDSLQILNINLYNDNRKKNGKLDEIVQRMTIEKAALETKVTELNNKNEVLNRSNEDLHKKIHELNTKIGSKDNKVGSLEQEIQWIHTTNPDFTRRQKTIERLRKDLKNRENTINSKNKEIETKDKFIATLSK